MVAYDKLQAALENRVGFRPTFNTADVPPIADDLKISDSGLLFNSLNEQFLTNENIFRSIRFFNGQDVNAWDGVTSYNIGDISKDGGFVWVSKADGNLNNVPGVEQTNWESALSYQLRQYRQSAINQMINDALTSKALAHYSRRLLGNEPLFSQKTVGSNTTKKGRFVGLEIIPAARNNLAIELQKLGLRLDAPESVSFTVFHSSNENPIATFNVNISTANKFTWSEELKNVFSFIDEDSNIGGRYFVGYFEDDVVANVYEWKYPAYWSQGLQGCISCKSLDINYGYYENGRGYYGAHAIYIDAEDLNGGNLPDLGENFDNVHYSNKVSLNARFSVYCDPTNAVIETISMWDKPLQAKCVELMLTDLLNSNRVNSAADNNERKIEIILRGAFNNGELVQKGITHYYADYIKQIEIDYENIDPACWANNRMLQQGAQ